MGRNALLTVAEAARIAGVTPQALCIAMREGRLPYEVVKVDAKRINEKDLALYVARVTSKLSGD